MIVVRGEAYGATYDYKCELLRRTTSQVVFVTLEPDAGHIITLTPRYVGSIIGSADIMHEEGPAIVCAFVFDGNYAALAFLVLKPDGNVLIIPHEH